jgi:hypothetical protein
MRIYFLLMLLLQSHGVYKEEADHKELLEELFQLPVHKDFPLHSKYLPRQHPQLSKHHE